MKPMLMTVGFLTLTALVVICGVMLIYYILYGCYWLCLRLREPVGVAIAAVEELWQTLKSI